MLADNPLDWCYNGASRACSGGSVRGFFWRFTLEPRLLRWKTLAEIIALNVLPRPSARLAHWLVSEISDGVIQSDSRVCFRLKFPAKHSLMLFFLLLTMGFRWYRTCFWSVGLARMLLALLNVMEAALHNWISHITAKVWIAHMNVFIVHFS